MAHELHQRHEFQCKQRLKMVPDGGRAVYLFGGEYSPLMGTRQQSLRGIAEVSGRAGAFGLGFASFIRVRLVGDCISQFIDRSKTLIYVWALVST